MKRVAILAVLGVGCGGGASGTIDGGGGIDDSGAPTIDGGGAVATPDADVSCTTPGPVSEATWVEGYVEEVLARLTGVVEIAPGVMLADRASPAARDAVRAYLIDELEGFGYEPAVHMYETGSNVWAKRSSADPGGPTVVLGAHFDSIPDVPAAADNGTGTALVLAAARWFASACVDVNLVFVFFDQEESGLIGSHFFAEKLVIDGVPVAAVHNFDMISFDGDGDRAIELWSAAPELEALYEAAGTVHGMPIRSVPFEFSDHQSFIDYGFTTVGVSEEYVSGDHTPHYHQPTDTLDKIDLDYLGDATRLVFDVVGGQVLP